MLSNKEIICPNNLLDVAPISLRGLCLGRSKKAVNN